MKKRDILDQLSTLLNVDEYEKLLNIVQLPPVILTITYVNNKIYVHNNLGMFNLDEEQKLVILRSMINDTLTRLEGENGTRNDEVHI